MTIAEQRFLETMPNTMRGIKDEMVSLVESNDDIKAEMEKLNATMERIADALEKIASK